MKFAPPLPALRFPLWLILGGVGVLILIQQFVELPGTSMLLLALNNAAHTPFFTVLTLALWQLHPLLPPHFTLKKKLQRLTAIMVALAGATELTQIFTIRDASLQDWLRNMLGIGAALCFITLWHLRGRISVTAQVALGLAGVLLVAYGFRDVITVVERYQQRANALPHLLVMEDDYLRRMVRRFGTWRLGHKGEFYAASGREAPVDPERDTLLLLLDQGNYPGITLREPYADWHQYEWLSIEAESLDDLPLRLTVRVETKRDRGMENTYEIFLPSQPTVIRLPLATLIKGTAEERLDIRSLLLFADGQQQSKGVLLYDLRLE